MWPYSDDEANWLTPPQPVEQAPRKSANDNDPGRRVTPVRTTPELQQSPVRDADLET